MRRSRSNDGHRTSFCAALPIAPGLLASLIAEFAEVRERQAPKLYHGPRAATGGPASHISDEQVLVIRRMRGWYGMTARQIADALDLKVDTVQGLVSWKNRVHLDPGPRPTLAEEPASPIPLPPSHATGPNERPGTNGAAGFTRGHENPRAFLPSASPAGAARRRP